MSSARSLTLARLGSQRVVVAAAMVTIVLATVLLTALWVYVGAAATGGVRAAIASSSEIDTGLSVGTTTRDPAALDDLDGAVRDAIARTFAAVPYDVGVQYRSTDSYTLPAAAVAAAGAEELTVLGWYADVARHAELTDGAWPSPTADGDAVQVAVHRSAADALGLAVGDGMTVVQRLGEVPVDVVVSGTYEPVEPAGWYWRADDLDTTGFASGTSFPSRGPLLLADLDTLVSDVASTGVAPRWQVGPRWAEVVPAGIEPTRAGLAALRRDLSADRLAPVTGTVTIDTELDQLLTLVQRALVSNRSMMVVPLLQLAVLSAYTLLLAARLLADHRRGETALLRARGMSRRQVLGLALRETAMLVVPAAVLAPLAATQVLRLVDGQGPFSALSGTVDRPAPSWWLVSAAAALLCGAALVIPSVRRPGTYVEAQSGRGRTVGRSGLQRAGVDVLLLAGAVLAYLQLRHYRSPVVASGPAPQIDPLLVLGPCLALLAAAAVSLRLLSVVAAVAQRLAARGLSLGPALGAWQVARRPLRYSGPALLLVLALAIGAMSSAYSASWRQSQRDQAVFSAGADVRVVASATSGSVPALGQSAAVGSLGGVEQIGTAWRSAVTFGDNSVDLVALDAVAAPAVLRLRPDLAGGSTAELMAPLAEGRWSPEGIDMPGEPAVLAVTVTATSVPLQPIGVSPEVVPGALGLVVRDAAGSTIRLDPDPVRFDGTEQQVTVDLRSTAGPDGPVAVEPAYPLRVIGARLVLPTPLVYGPPGSDDYVAYRSTLVVTGIAADGTTVTAPRPAWEGSASQPNSYFATGTVTAPPDGVLAAEVVSVPNSDRSQAVTVVAGSPDGELRAVLDRTAATASGAAVGERLTLRLGGTQTTAVVSALVDAFPGTDPTAGAVVVDYPTIAATRWLGSAALTSPSEWWLASSDQGATATAAGGVPGLASSVVSVDGLSASYGDDPLGAMTLGALVAGFGAALAFAAVAFGVNLVIGARERLSEFSVLRALGVSRRQVLATLLVEQAFLVCLGVGVGLVIGVAVSALVVPLVIISPRAPQVFPPVVLDIPWLTLAATAVGATALLGALVAVAASRLQRAGLGASLRLGGEL